MPSLVLFPRPGVRTRLFNIYRRITTIGSEADNEIVLDGDDIRTNHCQIFFDGKKYIISALDRGADIFVNGKKTRKGHLQDQDVVRVGNYTMQFSLYDIPAEEMTSDVSVRDSVRKLLEFTTALMEEHDIQSLIDLMLDKLIELTGADKGFLFLVDDGAPTVHSARDIDREALPLDDGGFSDSIVQQAVKTARPVLVSDALSHTQFRKSQSVMNLKLCSVMCAPMLARGELVGVIYLGNDNVVNLFDQESLDVLQVFASQAALLVRNAILINELTVRAETLEEELEEIRFGKIIGASSAMRSVYKRVDRVATTDIGVLIRGETGSGKELIAREIHLRSDRADGPFVAINCGAIPDNLLESELFGHEKGAYTGAHAAAQGKFQAASGGTLFLDEIGDMPVTLQAKLLRALEQKQVVRVGGTKPEDVDIRIVAATNKNLEEGVAKNEFRQDLYFRLNVVTLFLPPLRDREDDVILIANYFLQRFTAEYKSKAVGFSKGAQAAMIGHSWPGNVRELENRIRKTMVLADNTTLDANDLEIPDENIGILPLADAKDNFQRDYVTKILELNAGNKTKTARDLGVDPRTIFRYLEKERSEEE
jgi:transcriptional regulator with GAF, ATPase, and Fis domain